MNWPFKVISTGLGPNVFLKDVLLSLWELGWLKKEGKEADLLEKLISHQFEAQAISFNSGRSALLAVLSCLGLRRGDEVLIQAYTCVAVPDAVLWAGCKPVYVDVDKTFNLSPVDLARKISKRSKAIIIQHTFGIPAQIEKILAVARRHNLVVIEDCAHSLGVKKGEKLLGTFADVTFLSFGKDKVVSSVYGGMVICKDKTLAKKIKQFQAQLQYPQTGWIIIQLLYNPLSFLIVHLYKLWGAGKILHLLCKKLGLLSKAVQQEEKKGVKPDFIPQKMPASLARLALSQLDRLDELAEKRLTACQLYQRAFRDLPIVHPPTKIPLLRYTVLVEDRERFLRFARKHNIYLDSWYDSPIAPKDTDLAAVGYKLTSCPMAEELARKSLNFPTNPNLSADEIKKVIRVVQNYYDQN